MSLWKREQPEQADHERQGSAPTTASNPTVAEHVDIPGDRNISPTHRARSPQSRLTNLLALGLGALVVGGFLVWYYKNTFAEHARQREGAQAASAKKAQGEMFLPSLGRVDPPVVERALGPPPPLPAEIGPLPVEPDRSSPPGPIRATHESLPGPQPDASLERRLGGPALVTASMAESSASRGTPARAGAFDGRATASDSGTSSRGDLGSLLEPTATAAVRANVLPTRRLLLPKGSFLDCTLETAIDSSLPGMTTCVMATDAFSADGSVVLLERGTKLIGETRGQVRQGTRRLFVLWTEARTPTGVVVPLASPGTDELGRSGLAGEIDRHFWDRFGAAILISVIDGAIQAAIQHSNEGGAVIINPSASRDIMTEVLKNTIDIPPTLTKQNGDRIAIFVARDLDFRSVYELRAASLAE